MSVTNHYNGVNLAGYLRGEPSQPAGARGLFPESLSSLIPGSGRIVLNDGCATVQTRLHDHLNPAQQLLSYTEPSQNLNKLPDITNFEQRLAAERQHGTDVPSLSSAVSIQEGNRHLNLLMRGPALAMGQGVLRALLAQPDCSATLGDIADHLQEHVEPFRSVEQSDLIDIVEGVARSNPNCFRLSTGQDSRESTLASLTEIIQSQIRTSPT